MLADSRVAEMVPRGETSAAVCVSVWNVSIGSNSCGETSMQFGKQWVMAIATVVVLVCGNFNLIGDEPEWKSLFDGESFDGWKINENEETWKIEDGTIVCNGDRSHLFYVGDDQPFTDFELELEVKTNENSNSGVYFHTRFQETGWPKFGQEAQVNNTYNSDPRKTASIYGIKDITEQLVDDNEWWKYNIRVVGKTVTIRINGEVVNEYTEPEDQEAFNDQFERRLGSGTFALQGHDPGSTVAFRNIRVRRLNAE